MRRWLQSGHFINVKNYEKLAWQFNYWNYALNRPFIDVKTMNINQKMVILIEKMMKAYSKVVIVSL